MMKLESLMLCMFAAVAATQANSQEMLLQAIKNQIATKAEIDVERIHLDAIDRRLAVTDCESELIVNFPFKKNLNTVQVSCSSPSFDIYLAVAYRQSENIPSPELNPLQKNEFWTVKKKIDPNEELLVTDIIHQGLEPLTNPLPPHPMGNYIDFPSVEVRAKIELKPGDPVRSTDLDVSISIPTATQNLAAGILLTEQLITTSRLSVTNLQPNIVTTFDEAVGFETLTRIQAGKPLRRSSLRLPKLVKTNETVTVIFENGALTLKTSAIALENGTLGQEVEVLNPNSGKQFTTEVIGKGVVTRKKR